MLFSKTCEISPRADRNLIILSFSDLIRVGHTILAYIEKCCSTLSEFYGDVPELMPKIGAVGLGGWCFGWVWFFWGGEGGLTSGVWVRGVGDGLRRGGGKGVLCVLYVFDVLLYVY